MKKAFFALALLISTIATAAVKVDVTARCGQDSTEASLVLSDSENQLVLEHDSGVKTVISLESENEDSAELAIVVSKGEQEISASHATLIYGQPETFKCPSSSVDASLTIVVSHVNQVTE
jgi:hypothetical protein